MHNLITESVSSIKQTVVQVLRGMSDLTMPVANGLPSAMPTTG